MQYPRDDLVRSGGRGCILHLCWWYSVFAHVRLERKMTSSDVCKTVLSYLVSRYVFLGVRRVFTIQLTTTLFELFLTVLPVQSHLYSARYNVVMTQLKKEGSVIPGSMSLISYMDLVCDAELLSSSPWLWLASVCSHSPSYYQQNQLFSKPQSRKIPLQDSS
jgi:hypothetical protein